MINPGHFEAFTLPRWNDEMVFLLQVFFRKLKPQFKLEFEQLNFLLKLGNIRQTQMRDCPAASDQAIRLRSDV